MKKHRLPILLAFAAALLGLVVSVMMTGPGALLRTEAGQWLVQEVWTPAPQGHIASVSIGQTVPAFKVQDFTQQHHQLPQAGHWQIINYWASWCAPCRQEMPWLEALQHDHQNTIQVIGIALEIPRSAQQYAAERPLIYSLFYELPSRNDSSVRLGNTWGVLPFSVLIDPQGRLVKRHLGVFQNPAQLQEWATDRP